jgi:predicted metal-binding membrane protein
VWTVFSAAATTRQRGLAAAFVLTPMMEPATPIAGAIVLTIAGIYQLAPAQAGMSALTRLWRACASENVLFAG